MLPFGQLVDVLPDGERWVELAVAMFGHRLRGTDDEGQLGIRSVGVAKNSRGVALAKYGLHHDAQHLHFGDIAIVDSLLILSYQIVTLSLRRFAWGRRRGRRFGRGLRLGFRRRRGLR